MTSYNDETGKSTKELDVKYFVRHDPLTGNFRVIRRHGRCCLPPGSRGRWFSDTETVLDEIGTWPDREGAQRIADNLNDKEKDELVP